jgi:hypothetical protein
MTRYDLEDGQMVEHPQGNYVLAEDVEALQAKCERLREALQDVADSWTGPVSDCGHCKVFGPRIDDNHWPDCPFENARTALAKIGVTT